MFDQPDAAALEGDAELWEIYRSSFPSSEREPASVITASVRDGVGIVVRARTDGSTTGFSFTHLLTGPPPAAFLVYLVVSNTHRSRGLGKELFRETRVRSDTRQAQSGRASVGLIWEVEIPQLAVTTEERMLRERRINFFRSLGGELLARPYLQPPVDGVAPVPMQLMFLSSRPEQRVDESMVNALVSSIYREKYERRNGIARGVIDRLL